MLLPYANGEYLVAWTHCYFGRCNVTNCKIVYYYYFCIFVRVDTKALILFADYWLGRLLNNIAVWGIGQSCRGDYEVH